MERRQLGTTDLELTAVGVGTAPIGSGRDWPVWWGPQDDAASIRAIRHALDLGVNWIDTAAYGFGRSEQIVGRALEGLSARERPFVFTKASPVEGPGRSVLHSPGMVRHIGVSNFGVEQLQRAQQIAPVETLQPLYSLIDRDVEDELLPRRPAPQRGEAAARRDRRGRDRGYG